MLDVSAMRMLLLFDVFVLWSDTFLSVSVVRLLMAFNISVMRLLMILDISFLRLLILLKNGTQKSVF